MSFAPQLRERESGGTLANAGASRSSTVMKVSGIPAQPNHLLQTQYGAGVAIKVSGTSPRASPDCSILGAACTEVNYCFPLFPSRSQFKMDLTVRRGDR